MNRNTTAQVFLATLFIFTLSACQNKQNKQHGLMYYNDFESVKGWVKDIYLVKQPVHSGNLSERLDSGNIYGQTLKLKLKEVDPSPLRKVKYKLWCYIKSTKAEGKFVISIDDPNHKNLFWAAKPIDEFVKEAGKWTEVNIEWGITHIPGANNPNNIISIFPWNLSKEEFYVDDISVEFVK